MEQVIYINSRPFVLRDVEQPFSNLEYTVCQSPDILILSSTLIFIFVLMRKTAWGLLCGLNIEVKPWSAFNIRHCMYKNLTGVGRLTTCGRKIWTRTSFKFSAIALNIGMLIFFFCLFIKADIN